MALFQIIDTYFIVIGRILYQLLFLIPYVDVYVSPITPVDPGTDALIM